MNDTPTPETEANLHQNITRTGVYMVDGELSRKLERERDAALARCGQLDGLRVRVGELNAELDKVTKNLKFLHDEYAILKAERDSETRWAATYKAERDALQKAVDTYCEWKMANAVHLTTVPEIQGLFKLAKGAK